MAPASCTAPVSARARPVFSKMTIGLPTAATASTSACCTVGTTICVRDCASPLHACGSPMASSTTSAWRAAATASSKPPSMGASDRQPRTTESMLGSESAPRMPLSMFTIRPLSPKSAQVPSRFLVSEANGPIRAIRWPLFRNGSTAPSFFSSTMDSVAVLSARASLSALRWSDSMAAVQSAPGVQLGRSKSRILWAAATMRKAASL
mmetsp:Transcript_39563/g.119820  ORF Transcript_39563/g.119820 Transcript_39563/m.119820 type:complete len:207 (-) Transcript_39563:12-632(-)